MRIVIDRDKFNLFMSSVGAPERRAAPRTEAAGGKKNTPKGAIPNPPSF